jgi:hypothetical protein
VRLSARYPSDSPASTQCPRAIALKEAIDLAEALPVSYHTRDQDPDHAGHVNTTSVAANVKYSAPSSA